MKRLEIFANYSIQEEVLQFLETLPNWSYTLVPVVHGKGRKGYKLGTIVWPEENFLLISYLEDQQARQAIQGLAKIKQAFPQEGLRFFIVDATGLS